jgi:hypothetical protein
MQKEHGIKKASFCPRQRLTFYKRRALWKKLLVIGAGISTQQARNHVLTGEGHH